LGHNYGVTFGEKIANYIIWPPPLRDCTYYPKPPFIS